MSKSNTPSFSVVNLYQTWKIDLLNGLFEATIFTSFGGPVGPNLVRVDTSRAPAQSDEFFMDINSCAKIGVEKIMSRRKRVILYIIYILGHFFEYFRRHKVKK
jgi:hypothetical protein